jgi:hypothetical protein
MQIPNVNRLKTVWRSAERLAQVGTGIFWIAVLVAAIHLKSPIGDQ